MSTEPLLEPDEPPAFEIINEGGRGRAILVCDHARNRMPRRLGTLGVEPRDLDRHIAWDIGAENVARRLSVALDEPLIASGYSRLVVDCNRPPTVRDFITVRSEDVDIPGNVSITDAECSRRVEALFWPYQDAVHRVVTSRLGNAQVPVMILAHSYTPVYLGEKRPWDIGVLYRTDERLGKLVLEGLAAADPALCLGERDKPYPVAIDEDFTVPVHAEARGIPYVLFEIRQDQIASDAGAQSWAERLAAVFREAIVHPSLAGFAERATDVHEPRYI